MAPAGPIPVWRCHVRSAFRASEEASFEKEPVRLAFEEQCRQHRRSPIEDLARKAKPHINQASSEKSVGHRYAPIAPEAQLAQPANPMWDSAASAPCFL